VSNLKKTLNKGFTLIELLVVVAIIAILALIVLLALNPVEMARRSRDSRRLSDLGTVRRAIDLALADGKTLPTGTSDYDITTTDPTTTFGTSLDVSKYLSVIPQDPANDGSTDTLQLTNACGNDVDNSHTKGSLYYHFQSDGDTYILSTRLESKDNCAALSEDGNPDNAYEIGTAPGLKY
jgi:prepilin-type N-terminal cleavage/methylation domain-containing protein